MKLLPYLSIAALLALAILLHALLRRRREFLVRAGTTSVLLRKGRIEEALPPGRHVRWGRHLEIVPLDLRRTLLQVPGQDVLTSDQVGVKLSLTATIRIADPFKVLQAVDSHVTHLYHALQGAVRTAVAGQSMEALLEQRVAIGEAVRLSASPLAEAVGVALESVEVRDVMLPGELRKAFSEVLKAKQEGQAALERARGESAALRSLANAARLLEAQPALTTLRFLQTLEQSGLQPKVVLDASGMIGRK